MDQAGPQKIYSDAIKVALTYSVDTGEKPVNETMEAGNLERKYTGVFDEHVMTVHNGRARQEGFSLDKHGFELIEHPTQVKNFFDPNELSEVYYPEVEKIVQRVSGASRVVIFDHTIRSGNRADREEGSCASRCTASIMITLSGPGRSVCEIYSPMKPMIC